MRIRTLTVILVSVLTLAVQGIAHAATYDDVPSRSWQVDGRVYATVIVGDTVYVGGSFSRATSPSGVVVTRPNLAAFSLSTGELRSGFAGNAGSSVRALVSDGTSLYVGGHFGRIAGVSRARLAKVDLVTGQVDTRFRADADGGVLSLALHDGQIYAGGAFTTIGGFPHTRLAKLDANSGAVDSGFTGSADNVVRSVVKHPTSNVLYAAGYFRTLNGTSRYGVGAVSSQTGAVTGPAFANSARPTLALTINDDGTRLYGALASASNSVSAWRMVDGTRAWSHRADGDVQAVTHHDGQVYFGFHDGFQGDRSLRLLVADAHTGALDTQFRPAFDLFWGVFSVAASDEGLVAGGEFSQVSGVSARGFVLFPDRPGGGGTSQR